MRLQRIQLQNFRNYELLDLDLSGSDVLALIGPNAQGKTNLLESIAFLALGKSFRTRHAMETLAWDRPHGRIRGTLVDQNSDEDSSHVRELELEVFFQRDPETRKFKRQGQVTGPKEFLGNLKVVIFTPDHLNLIYGSPRIRRQYMDRVLVQLDKNYLDAITNYQKVLKQRNALLKRIQVARAQDWELELWDAQLVTEAERIWKRRKQLIDDIQKQLAGHYQTLSGSEQVLKLNYKPQYDRFEERLLVHRDQDLRTGSTSIGPHRDDFRLFLEGRDIDEFGSRGECRSAVLALKVSEMQCIEALTGQRPLLLLDDVFSELDSERQKQMGELIEGYQCVITTTAQEHLNGLKGAKVCHLNKGRLE